MEIDAVPLSVEVVEKKTTNMAALGSIDQRRWAAYGRDELAPKGTK